jgi:hypothetical protein
MHGCYLIDNYTWNVAPEIALRIWLLFDRFPWKLFSIPGSNSKICVKHFRNSFWLGPISSNIKALKPFILHLKSGVYYDLILIKMLIFYHGPESFASRPKIF